MVKLSRCETTQNSKLLIPNCEDLCDNYYLPIINSVQLQILY